MKNIATVFLLLFAGLNSEAGPRVGNGGDVIICPSAQGPTVELLDHYEARAIRNIAVDLGPATDDYVTKVQRVLSKLESMDPSRATLYQGWLADFEGDAKFTNDRLVKIPDTGATTFPQGCELEQIAIHQDPDLPGDHRYIIRLDLWNALSSDGRAGLVLHEFIYRELVTQQYDVTSSKYARYFNSYISSKLIDGRNRFEYYDLLLRSGFEKMDTQWGFPIYIQIPGPNGPQRARVEFYDSGLIKYAEYPAPLLNSLTYQWRGQTIQVAEGACSQQPRTFNEDGLPRCFDTRSPEITLNLGWISGTWAVRTWVTSVNVQDTETAILISGNYYCDQGPIPEQNKVAFHGDVHGQTKSLVEGSFFLDPQGKSIQGKKSSGCMK